MKKLPIQIVVALLCSYGFSQGAIKGTIPEWSGGSGQVGVMSMGPPEIVGSFDPQGNVEIPLKPNALAEVKKQVEEANQGSSGGWSASIPTVAERYACAGEGQEMEIEGGDQLITGLGGPMGFLLVNMEEKKRYGYLVIASSRDFVEAMEPYTFETGYSLEWYYVDQEATVKGYCSMPSYAVNQEDLYTKTTTYDLQLKKGWNIVRYEIQEVYTDGEGNSYIMNESYTTLDAMPDGVRFVFLED